MWKRKPEASPLSWFHGSPEKWTSVKSLSKFCTLVSIYLYLRELYLICQPSAVQAEAFFFYIISDLPEPWSVQPAFYLLVKLQHIVRPSEILPQALEHTGQGVGSRTGGGKIRQKEKERKNWLQREKLLQTSSTFFLSLHQNSFSCSSSRRILCSSVCCPEILTGHRESKILQTQFHVTLRFTLFWSNSLKVASTSGLLSRRPVVLWKNIILDVALFILSWK